ncbi:hypothetical protein [Deinococcus arenicola]|uniref:Uncharacterized protein n=1 Tax=Deinococcus arenicola TaxID=2994950 RepID=A0ABU4DUF6_9DEIO|nr:hypothetical protein [Deinococcus sp. ZS9-10]MDV6376047.1 hypothetical protein [Deinococcus sp. ZS9-10]
MTTLPRSSAPWIVERPARFSDAAEDFLNELTRQQPWRKARCEEWLEALSDALGDPILGAAFPEDQAHAWLCTLPDAEELEGRALVGEFDSYLREWGWLTPRP